MAQIISLKVERVKRKFDKTKDPCSYCDEKNRDKNCPCETADIWWDIVADKIGRIPG